jgi:5,10-methylenetetrahydromethanopterin reductase
VKREMGGREYEEVRCLGVAKQFGIAIKGTEKITELLSMSQVAEKMGFSTYWIAEDYFFGGAFSMATACAAGTSKIKIGIGVLNPFTRHPALTAMETAALSNFSGNRLMLGVGSSNAHWIQNQMGIPFEAPLSSVQDCVEIVRKMLAGGKVTHQGKRFSVKEAELELSVTGKVPIYLGVKGEKGLQMAGEIADGILLSAGVSVPYVKWAMDHLAKGAEKSKDGLANFDVAAYLLISIHHDGQKAREAIKNRVARTIGLHGNHPILLTAGFRPEEIKPFREAFLRREKAGHLVTEKMIDLLAIAGTPAECQEKFKKILDAGVTQPILCDIEEISLEENMQMVREYLFPLLADG